MLKKIILASLCVFLSILSCGCFWKKKTEDKSVTKGDIDGTIDSRDFARGSLGSDAYTNDSAGLKFQLPDGFEFVDAAAIIEDSEMSAEGTDCKINIFSIYVDNSFDINKNISDSELKLKEYCTCDVIRVGKDEAEKFCGKDYVAFEGSGFVGEKISDVKGYIRRIGNRLFCVEIAYAKGQKKLFDKPYQAFSAVEVKETNENNKEESLDSEKKDENQNNISEPENYDETKDTTVERTADALSNKYNKGTVNEVEGSYVNNTMGLSFQLPEDFKFKKVERADQEMLVHSSDSKVRCYLIGERTSSSMNKYVQAFVNKRKRKGNTIVREGKLDDTEQFVGKDWRVIETKFKEKGKNFSEKTYIRIYNDKAVSITLSAEESNKDKLTTLEGAFSKQ